MSVSTYIYCDKVISLKGGKVYFVSQFGRTCSQAGHPGGTHDGASCLLAARKQERDRGADAPNPLQRLTSKDLTLPLGSTS